MPIITITCNSFGMEKCTSQGRGFDGVSDIVPRTGGKCTEEFCVRHIHFETKDFLYITSNDNNQNKENNDGKVMVVRKAKTRLKIGQITTDENQKKTS